MSCPYKNLFGAPGTGAHSYRFMGLAVVVVVLTFVAAGLLSWTFRTPYWPTLLVLFLAGIALHRLFCVRTTLDKLLFSDNTIDENI
jgi:hypothetical protein